jgi:pantothenate kinase
LRDQDGYHFPKSALSAFDNPEQAFRRRGAPFTYDADAFVKLVMALRKSPVTASDELQLAFRVPSFDHSIQDPVHNDICVSSSDRIVILEGNYLLLDEEPWNVVAKLVDERYVELTQIHLQLCSPAPL